MPVAVGPYCFSSVAGRFIFVNRTFAGHCVLCAGGGRGASKEVFSERTAAFQNTVLQSLVDRFVVCYIPFNRPELYFFFLLSEKCMDVILRSVSATHDEVQTAWDHVNDGAKLLRAFYFWYVIFLAAQKILLSCVFYEAFYFFFSTWVLVLFVWFFFGCLYRFILRLFLNSTPGTNVVLRNKIRCGGSC